MTYADIVFTPKSHSELMVSVYDIKADIWDLWIHKDAPPTLLPYIFLCLIITVVGFGITVISGNRLIRSSN